MSGRAAGHGAWTATGRALPPIDPEADRFIAENFQKYPEARYRITQMAVVQEAALAQAQNRIRQLEFQLQQAQQQLAQVQQSGGSKPGLFGACSVAAATVRSSRHRRRAGVRRPLRRRTSCRSSSTLTRRVISRACSSAAARASSARL